MKLFSGIYRSESQGSESTSGNGTFPVGLTSVLTSIGVSVSEHTLGESFVIDNLDVISESVDLRHVEVSVLLELNLSLLDGGDGVFPGSLGSGFHVLGEDDIVLKLGGPM